MIPLSRNSLVTSPELREAYNRYIARISNFSTEFGQNEKLFGGYKALAAMIAAPRAAAWLGGRSRRWRGGYTGDCLGAVQQVTEVAFYLGFFAQWSRVI